MKFGFFLCLGLAFSSVAKADTKKLGYLKCSAPGRLAGSQGFFAYFYNRIATHEESTVDMTEDWDILPNSVDLISWDGKKGQLLSVQVCRIHSRSRGAGSADQASCAERPQAPGSGYFIELQSDPGAGLIKAFVFRKIQEAVLDDEHAKTLMWDFGISTDPEGEKALITKMVCHPY